MFDGHCRLCDGTVSFVLRRDRRERFRFAALQSEAGRELLARQGVVADGLDSVRLLEGGRLFQESEAVLRILRGLGLPWSLLGALRLVPRPLRDGLYRWVARHRYRWFGRRASCRLPLPGEESRFLDGKQG